MGPTFFCLFLITLVFFTLINGNLHTKTRRTTVRPGTMQSRVKQRTVNLISDQSLLKESELIVEALEDNKLFKSAVKDNNQKSRFVRSADIRKNMPEISSLTAKTSGEWLQMRHTSDLTFLKPEVISPTIVRSRRSPQIPEVSSLPSGIPLPSQNSEPPSIPSEGTSSVLKDLPPKPDGLPSVPLRSRRNPQLPDLPSPPSGISAPALDSETPSMPSGGTTPVVNDLPLKPEDMSLIPSRSRRSPQIPEVPSPPSEISVPSKDSEPPSMPSGGTTSVLKDLPSKPEVLLVTSRSRRSPQIPELPSIPSTPTVPSLPEGASVPPGVPSVTGILSPIL